MKKTKDKAKIVIIILAVIAVIAAAGAVYAGMQNKKADKEKEEVSAEPESTDGSSYITYNGKKYKYNSDLRTMLFMGVDKNEVVTVKENTGRSGQSDCLVLLVLDTDKKTTTLLEISRDSMADVKIYGIDGDYMATETAQIATQYAYGDGEKRSCQLTREAVSNLLYEYVRNCSDRGSDRRSNDDCSGRLHRDRSCICPGKYDNTEWGAYREIYSKP